MSPRDLLNFDALSSDHSPEAMFSFMLAFGWTQADVEALTSVTERMLASEPFCRLSGPDVDMLF